MEESRPAFTALLLYASKYATSTGKTITMYQDGEQITCTCREPNACISL